MRMVDLINKKRLGEKLTKAEIDFIIKGYCDESIPDYQMSAFLMAVCFQGLDEEELYYLTEAMIHSGEVIDLSSISGIKVDKHSTGGVGDKTSLVLGPLVASCNAKVAKMSGRGLGHTGGTLDKLESIPGFTIEVSIEDFHRQVEEIGLAIVGQNQDLVVADKKMYALRDVTGTVESIGLIASSIMSKKLASGADTILLDVKYGKGAFMKNVSDAEKLARCMIKIGESFHKNTKAMISNMNEPLGNAIGNSLEVMEAIQCLNGQGPSDLLELCLNAGSHMLVQAGITDTVEEGKEKLQEQIKNGQALNKLKEMVAYQHGDTSYIDDPQKFLLAPYKIAVASPKSGYVQEMDSLILGEVCMMLGGGRKTKADTIDHGVGLVLNKKTGDAVELGEPLLYMYSNHKDILELEDMVIKSYVISSEKTERPILIEQVI
ncbi:MAG: pyrimidine-nucleoside phosphorylase [Beduini sp.]|uniref:pyrimidine-nucleoside phosphorylase n=1 Tax=Beduini sp. TaxID=1922300 RepID=UPI0011CC50FC